MKTFRDYAIDIPSGATGPEVATTCPKCSDSRHKSNAKCLSVNIEKRAWHCNHCGWTGGLSAETWTPIARKIYTAPAPRVKSVMSKMGKDWLAERGITDAVIARNKIESGRTFFPQLQREVEAIIFPYFRKGELVNRKYRTIQDKHFRLEAGCELVLYGLDDIEPGNPLVWVEGEMDKLAMEVAGYRNVVSVPNGAPALNTKNYESHCAFLDSSHEQLGAVKKFIIAVDSDAPGTKLEDELSRRLGADLCLRVRWPEGCKDANDVLVKHGADDLKWFIENAEPFPVEDVFEVSSQADSVKEFYANGYERGRSTGWKTLDRYYTVRPGEFTAVSGFPSSGKSNLIDALMINMARLHDWRFAIFSPENLPLEQHIAALAEKYAKQPFNDGYLERMSRETLDSTLEWLDKRFFWILPGVEDNWTVDKILAAAAKLCLRHGIRGLVIDPWNELESLRPPSMTETEYISASLKRIKVFARTHKVHVWVVIHPTKLYRDKNGKYPIPTLSDCAGSAHWRAKADNGIIVARDLDGEDKSEIEIHVQKIRFRDIGQRGMAQLYYEKPTATYSEFGPLRAVNNWQEADQD